MSRRHAAIVLAVALLVVMHAPAVVGAAGGTLVVGSQHTTETDFNNGTLTNLTVTGSGSEASLELLGQSPVFTDGFEDESADSGIPDNWEIASGSATYEVSTTRAFEGSQSFHVSGSSGSVVRPAEQVYGSNILEPISFAIYNVNGENNIDVKNGGGNLMSVYMRSGDLYAYYDGGYQLLATEPDNGEWVEIQLSNIDPSADTYDVIWSTESGESGTVTDVPMRGDMPSSGYDETVFRNTDESFWDDFRIGENVPESANYVSTDHSVSNPQEAAINITQASNVSVDAKVRTDGGTVLGSDTITTTGNHSIALSSTSSSQLETVLNVTVTGDNPQFELADESILFTDDAPTIDNSSASPGGGNVITGTPELSLNVSDPQFGTVQGEELTVEWYVDGQKRGESTATQNGTVSYTLSAIDGGEHTWHAVVTDSYGASATSDTFSFAAPSELRVYSETNPSQLIDGSQVDSLRLRFFVDDSEQVIEREITDGTANLSGLPANERFVVTVRANDSEQWTYRRIVVDSLIETSSIYLLNTSEPHSEIIFELDDPTGQFPPEETTLYVEKPITKDYDGDNETETRYQVIAGDTFGASGDFPVDLQKNARYRLRVETDSGQSSRILGFYSVSGPGVEPLQIERVEPSGDSNEGASFRASIDEKSGQRYIAIRFNDFANTTQAVEYEVLDQNGTVVVANTTRQAGEFADLYPVPAQYGDDASFTVNYQIVREQQNTAGSIDIGRLSGIADRFGLDPQILSLLSWAAILGSMGLVVIANERIAPITGTAVASGLTVVGTIAIPMVVLAVAGAVSILVVIGGVR